MHILSILTEEYRDLLQLSIPSWLKFNTVNKIYLYTDFDWEPPSSRIVVINDVPKNLNWLQICASKPFLMRDLIETQSQKINFIYLDADCVMFKDVSEVFETPFDIKAARLHLARSPVNAGVFFFRSNERTLKFANDWIKLQEEIRASGRGLKPFKNNYEQMAFSQLLRQANRVVGVSDLPAKYNCEADSKDRLLSLVSTYHPSIVHFKGMTWKDRDFVNSIKMCYKGTGTR